MMDVAVARQFVDFFQDFLKLCRLENWPNEETSEADIKNAFIISHHIEKCLDKLKNRSLIDDFLSTLSENQNVNSSMFKNCLTDPSKYILKKIITSDANITKVDVSLKIFVKLFSVAKLEKYLADIMLEAASIETLLRNIKEMPTDKMLDFKSQLFLLELSSIDDPGTSLLETLNSCNQEYIELLVVCMLNKDIKYHETVNNIVNTCISVMLNRTHSYKNFWEHLFHIEDKLLLKLCAENKDIFKMIATALMDCSKLLRENMSAEFFYIDLTYSQLVSIVQKICKNDNLKINFIDIIKDNSDLDFWENILI